MFKGAESSIHHVHYIKGIHCTDLWIFFRMRQFHFRFHFCHSRFACILATAVVYVVVVVCFFVVASVDFVEKSCVCVSVWWCSVQMNASILYDSSFSNVIIFSFFYPLQFVLHKRISYENVLW